MLISEKHKAIFIANPKTATTAVSKFLTSQDDSWSVNKFKKGNRVIKFGEHDYPTTIKQMIPSEYEEYKKFVFIRNPYDKVVSAYFFYKNGEPLTKGGLRAYNKSFVRFIKAMFTYSHVLMARALPFWLWSIVRPIKSNKAYLTDKSNIFLVNYVGVVEQLNDDLAAILNNLGVGNLEEVNVSKINTSSHKSTAEYYKGRIHKKIFDRIYSKEIRLYDAIKEKGPRYDFKEVNLSRL